MLRKLLILVLLIFTAAIYGCNDDTPKSEIIKNNSLATGETDLGNDPAPEFTLYTLDGEEIKLSDYFGKVVILDFWATWCPPCRKSIPDLISIQNEYKDDLIIIGISLDQPSSQSELQPFIESYGINYPVVLGTNQVLAAYGNVQAIPTSFIIDQEGNIINKHVGIVPKSTLVEEINALLRGK